MTRRSRRPAAVEGSRSTILDVQRSGPLGVSEMPSTGGACCDRYDHEVEPEHRLPDGLLAGITHGRHQV
jgi:hypothetical protein